MQRDYLHVARSLEVDPLWHAGDESYNCKRYDRHLIVISGLGVKIRISERSEPACMVCMPKLPAALSMRTILQHN